VRLRRGGGEDIPAVFGVFRPTVLIPAGADDWPEQRRRVVLLHELAHVKRRDCLTQLLAQLACVVYWFNPPAWLVARQLRIERERACDDLVLTAGQRPSEYADHLLEMVRTLRSRACPSFAAVAMAKKSNFEHRLLAILDAARPRQTLTKATTTIAFFTAVAILLPLAMLRVTPKTPVPSVTPSNIEKITEQLQNGIGKLTLDDVLKLCGQPVMQITVWPMIVLLQMGKEFGFVSVSVMEFCEEQGLYKIRRRIRPNRAMLFWLQRNRIFQRSKRTSPKRILPSEWVIRAVIRMCFVKSTIESMDRRMVRTNLQGKSRAA
jgi:hypothetical protein